MGVKRSSLMGIDIFKSNNYGINSMLVFAAALSTMERSLWKSRRFTTWYPFREKYFSECENEIRSMFCEYIKAHCPAHGECG